MCGGGSKSKPKEKTMTYTPNPRAVADTSNDYAQRRAAIATTGETQTQPGQTFGAELGG